MPSDRERGIDSGKKAKGKRGELQFASLCKREGYNCRRTAQYCGNAGDGAADVEGLPGIHVEVKHVEKMHLYDWISQSARDAEKSKDGGIPIVAHRKNNAGWLITMRADDWFKIYREWEAGRKMEVEE